MSKTKKYYFPIERGVTLSFDYSKYQHNKYIDDIKLLFGKKLLVLDFAVLQESPLNVLKAIESHLEVSEYFTADNFLLNKINASEQPMSKLYAFLFRNNLLNFLIPIALRLIPKKIIHWLRKRFVYG